MSFISTITGLYVFVLLAGIIFESIVIFALSKLFTKERQEFSRILKRVFLGVLIGVIAFLVAAYFFIPEADGAASLKEKQLQARAISGWRFILLFAPLVIGFISAVFPMIKSTFKK